MTIEVVRDRSQKMKHTVHVRQHAIPVDEPASNGGEDLGPTPHDLYDSALGACKALTMLWYAQAQADSGRGHPGGGRTRRQRGAPRDYRLRVTLELGGALTEAQRQELLNVAGKCPVHKLMTQATTEVVTELAPAAG